MKKHYSMKKNSYIKTVLKQRNLLIAACSLLLSGCFKMEYKFDRFEGEKYTSNRWNSYFLYGLAPVTEEYAPEDLCQTNKIISLKSRMRPENVLASALSLGLVGAETLTAHCLNPGSEARRE